MVGSLSGSRRAGGTSGFGWIPVRVRGAVPDGRQGVLRPVSYTSLPTPSHQFSQQRRSASSSERGNAVYLDIGAWELICPRSSYTSVHTAPLLIETATDGEWPHRGCFAPFSELTSPCLQPAPVIWTATSVDERRTRTSRNKRKGRGNVRRRVYVR